MKCGSCGNKTNRSKMHHEIKVGEARFTGTLPAEKCSVCDKKQIVLDDLIRFEHAVAKSLAEHGPVTGASLRSMRKSIPLTATELAELLRVAPETISRWETGERPVDRAAWLVVRQLVLEPGDVEGIAKIADEPPARPVAIAV